MSEDGVTAYKCKSHISVASRQGLDREATEIAEGNDYADDFARRGAALDVLEKFRTQAVHEEAHRVRGALTLLGSFAARAKSGGAWPDVTAWPAKAAGRVGRAGRRASLSGVRPPLSRPHFFEDLDGGKIR